MGWLRWGVGGRVTEREAQGRTAGLRRPAGEGGRALGNPASPDHLHAVQQGARDRVQHVGGAHEQHLRVRGEVSVRVCGVGWMGRWGVKVNSTCVSEWARGVG